MANKQKVNPKDTLAALQAEQAAKKQSKSGAGITPPPSQAAPTPEQVGATATPPVEEPVTAAGAGAPPPPPVTPPTGKSTTQDNLSHLPDAPPLQGFSPVELNPIERTYAMSTPLSPAEAAIPIPEPVIKPPPLTPPTGAGGPGAPPPPPHIPLAGNPQLAAASSADVHTAAVSAADGLIDAYEGLHEIAKQFLKVSDEDLLQHYEDEKFTPQTTISIGEDGEPISVVALTHSFNAGVDEVMVVTPEFKEKVKPVLVRVCEKRGFGFTDEELLMELVFKDVAVKGVSFFKMRGQINGAFAFMQKNYEKQRKMGATISEQEKKMQEQERIINQMRKKAEEAERAAAATAASQSANTADDISFGGGNGTDATKKNTSKKAADNTSTAVTVSTKKASKNKHEAQDVDFEETGFREPEEK